jgi:hypothetical protein
MVNCSIGLLAFGIGCMANYFWLFNYGEPLPVPSGGCVAYDNDPANRVHLVAGAASLLVSLFSLCLLTYTMHED